MGKRSFNVVLVHGHSRELRKLKQYVRDAGFTPRIMVEEYGAGDLFERWRNMIWDDIHCAIILMTQDDFFPDGSARARQNVVFELGYCFGAFDSLSDEGEYTPEDAIIVLREEGVQDFANIRGLLFIEFERGRLGLQKRRIIEALQRSYAKAKNYYSAL